MTFEIRRGPIERRDDIFGDRLAAEIHGLRAVARRRWGARGDDICQDALLRAWKRRERFRERRGERGSDGLRGWLRTILGRAGAEAFRRREKWEGSFCAGGYFFDPVDHRGREVGGESGELDEELRGALDRLPEGVRRALELAVVEGRDRREVAALLGCSVPAVKLRVHRGCVQMRKLFQSRPKGGMR